MKGKIKVDYWKVEESRYKLQLKTRIEQDKIEEALPGWERVSFGYNPGTSEDIYVFEKDFESEFDWTNFLNSDSVNAIMEMKEIRNE